MQPLQHRPLSIAYPPSIHYKTSHTLPTYAMFCKHATSTAYNTSPAPLAQLTDVLNLPLRGRRRIVPHARVIRPVVAAPPPRRRLCVRFGKMPSALSACVPVRRTPPQHRRRFIRTLPTLTQNVADPGNGGDALHTPYHTRYTIKIHAWPFYDPCTSHIHNTCLGQRH